MLDKIDHLKIAVLVLVVAGALSYVESEVRHGRERESAPPAARATATAELRAAAPATRGEVTDSNRASRIIGLPVRNRANERIGRVKDIVIDLRSGRVAYAVLATGWFGDDKLIAIPLGALKLPPGARSFVIDLPKDRWESARGFAGDHWPMLSAAEDETTVGLAGRSGESPATRATSEAKTPPSGADATKRP